MVQVAVAAALVVPSWSACRTWNVWMPSVRLLKRNGLWQGTNEALSIEQVNFPLLSPLNVTDALRELVCASGCALIDGAGIGVGPTTHDTVCTALVLPAKSV